MQQRLVCRGSNSQLSLIGINRVNSDRKVSDVYVCMPQNSNADGFSLTEDNTPMFEKFVLPDTPPPPPPRSDLPPSPDLPSQSPPVRSKPPPIPPRLSEAASTAVCQPKPPKPLPRYKRNIPVQEAAETHTKPPIVPRIVKRLSQRYSQRRRQNNKIPPESYEAFLANEEL